jgi:hypothetical protein
MVCIACLKTADAAAIILWDSGVAFALGAFLSQLVPNVFDLSLERKNDGCFQTYFDYFDC